MVFLKGVNGSLHFKDTRKLHFYLVLLNNCFLGFLFFLGVFLAASLSYVKHSFL